MIGGSVCFHGWVPRCDIKRYWGRPEFRGGVGGDRRPEEGDVSLWLVYEWQLDTARWVEKKRGIRGQGSTYMLYSISWRWRWLIVLFRISIRLIIPLCIAVVYCCCVLFLMFDGIKYLYYNTKKKYIYSIFSFMRKNTYFNFMWTKNMYRKLNIISPG